MLDDEISETPDSDNEPKCLLDANFVKDEIADGLSIIVELDAASGEQSYEHTVQPNEEDLWTVYLVNCKDSSLSMTVCSCDFKYVVVYALTLFF
jgi:hypothetical protein